jgi:nicotinamidase-related amidase
MHAGSTLFVDVGLQRDRWPGGAWPGVGGDEIREIERLCAIARELGVRRGGVLCLHAPGTWSSLPGPPHCVRGTPGAEPIASCVPALPVQVWTGDAGEAAARLDRAHAVYVASGCAAPVDATTATRRAFDHLTAGVRDAVVFGVGVEHGIARAVDGLLRRRIRAHVPLDAAGAVDLAEAQRVIATWKRRGVDAATTVTLDRLLRRG